MLGSAATFGIEPSDWARRLVAGYTYASRPCTRGVDARPAYKAMLGQPFAELFEPTEVESVARTDGGAGRLTQNRFRGRRGEA